ELIRRDRFTTAVTPRDGQLPVFAVQLDALELRRPGLPKALRGRDQCLRRFVPSAIVPAEGAIDGDEEALHETLGEDRVRVLGQAIELELVQMLFDLILVLLPPRLVRF